MDDERLITASDAAAMFGITTQAVLNWRRRGLIAIAGLDHRNRKLYRLVDVLRAEAKTAKNAGRA